MQFGHRSVQQPDANPLERVAFERAHEPPRALEGAMLEDVGYRAPAGV